MCAPDRPGSGSILLRCLSSPCQARSWPDGRCHDYSRPTTLCGWPSSRPTRHSRTRQRAPTLRRASRPFRRHAESPYHACVGTVQACPEPVEGDPERPRAGPAAPPTDLRVNVAKCRKMSHFFIPPLGECRALRVKNLTFLAHSRPFWPISVHFLCSSTEGGPPMAAVGRLAVDTGRARGSIAAMDGGERRSP